MKRRTNKYISLVLAVVMALSLCFPASALEPTEHKHGETECVAVGDLAAQVNGSEPGTVRDLYLTEDHTLKAPVTVDEGVTVNLCLNGHTLNLGEYTITNLGTLNITDCGDAVKYAGYDSNNYFDQVYPDETTPDRTYIKVPAGVVTRTSTSGSAFTSTGVFTASNVSFVNIKNLEVENKAGVITLGAGAGKTAFTDCTFASNGPRYDSADGTYETNAICCIGNEGCKDLTIEGCSFYDQCLITPVKSTVDNAVILVKNTLITNIKMNSSAFFTIRGINTKLICDTVQWLDCPGSLVSITPGSSYTVEKDDFTKLSMINCTLGGTNSEAKVTASGAVFANTTDCVIKGCTFKNIGMGRAALQLYYCEVGVNDCDFTNLGSSGAAAIEAQGYGEAWPCTVTVTDCNFDTITTAGCYGGAVRATSADMTFTGCDFLNCRCDYSGYGVSLGGVGYAEDKSTLKFEDCKITDSYAIACGVGYAVDGSTIEFERCTLTSSTSKNLGGALGARYGTLKLTDCTVSKAGNEYGGAGGAIYGAGKDTEIIVVNTNFSNCSAECGGCLFIDEFCKASFDGCKFENTAGWYMGGLAFVINGAELEMNNCTGTGINEATYDFNFVTENSIDEESTAELTENERRNCYNAYYGGALFVGKWSYYNDNYYGCNYLQIPAPSAEITNCSFTDYVSGTGTILTDCADVTITGTEITGNDVVSSGSAILSYSGAVKLEDVTITGNSVGTAELGEEASNPATGAVYYCAQRNSSTEAAGTLTLSGNCVISGNNVVVKDGTTVLETYPANLVLDCSTGVENLVIGEEEVSKVTYPVIIGEEGLDEGSYIGVTLANTEYSRGNEGNVLEDVELAISKQIGIGKKIIGEVDSGGKIIFTNTTAKDYTNCFFSDSGTNSDGDPITVEAIKVNSGTYAMAICTAERTIVATVSAVDGSELKTVLGYEATYVSESGDNEKMPYVNDGEIFNVNVTVEGGAFAGAEYELRYLADAVDLVDADGNPAITFTTDTVGETVCTLSDTITGIEGAYMSDGYVILDMSAVIADKNDSTLTLTADKRFPDGTTIGTLQFKAKAATSIGTISYAIRGTVAASWQIAGGAVDATYVATATKGADITIAARHSVELVSDYVSGKALVLVYTDDEAYSVVNYTYNCGTEADPQYCTAVRLDDKGAVNSEGDPCGYTYNAWADAENGNAGAVYGTNSGKYVYAFVVDNPGNLTIATINENLNLAMNKYYPYTDEQMYDEDKTQYDVNGSETVDLYDAVAAVAVYNTNSLYFSTAGTGYFNLMNVILRADTNRDKKVDTADVLYVLNNYGEVETAG